ncbi:MAG: hypothetical protein FIA97_04560 [Methylococcaceae bacterium]|nr:hypothetical protein [Methylococcaceae bacterium]
MMAGHSDEEDRLQRLGHQRPGIQQDPDYSGYIVPDDKKPEKREFVDVSEIGDRSRIADQEYAAAWNYSSLHPFYDVIQLRMTDGIPIRSWSAGTSPAALAFDGISVWVLNRDNDTALKL